jgi:hypothetical protein
MWKDEHDSRLLAEGQIQGPRRLSTAQRTELSIALQNAPGLSTDEAIPITWASDDESRQYAADFVSFFRSIGYLVKEIPLGHPDVEEVGIRVGLKDTRWGQITVAATSMIQALRSAGLVVHVTGVTHAPDSEAPKYFDLFIGPPDKQHR